MTKTVFTGTFDSTMTKLTDPALAAALQAAGVGLYGHGNGIYWMVANNQMPSLMAQWNDSQESSGVAEFGMSFGYATGTVSIKNTGSTDQIINIGDTFSTSSGLQYAVLASPGQPGVSTLGVANANGYVAQASGMGYFVVKAGSSLTLNMDATQIGTGSNVSAGQISSYNGGASNIQISSSSAMASGMSISDITSYFTGGQNAPMYYLYQKYGYSPLQGDVNISESYFTSGDLSTWKTWVDSARAAGVLNIAPITSYNGLNFNSASDFATSDYWANARAAIQYGGGVSFDMPPSFALSFTKNWYAGQNQPQNTYINFVESQIKWATSQGLRSSIIISPQDYDTSNMGGLLNATQALVARLKADGALPTQFIVENYGNTSNTYGTSSNSLNNVAVWLASQGLSTPSNSESMQQTAGSQNTQVDIMMSGIKPVSSVQGNGAVSSIYDNPALYGARTPGTVTVTVTINSSAIALMSNLGQQISGGWSYSGSTTDVTNFLQQLKVYDNATSSGTANLNLSFSDAKGTINGSTTINYAGGSSNQSGSVLTYGSIDYGHSASYINAPGMTNVYGTGALLSASSSDITFSGDYSSLSLSNIRSAYANATISGTATISNVTSGTLGLTVNPTASLNMSNSSAYLYMNYGSVNISGPGSSNVYGYAKDISLSNTKAYVALQVDGTASIKSVTGDVGVSLSKGASAVIENSVVYATTRESTVNTGDGAYVVLTSDYQGFANVNGGTVVYENDAASSNNMTFHVGNGTAKVDMDGGYTQVFQDMQAYSKTLIGDLDPRHGSLIASNLDSFNNLRIFYGNGNAYLQEDGRAGYMTIKDVAVGGVSTFTDLGGQNFSQLAGSKALLVAVTKQAGAVDISSGSGTFSGSSAYHVEGGNSTINLTSDASVSVDLSKYSSVHIQNTASSNLSLLLGNANAGDISASYSNGTTTISSKYGHTNVLLDGNYSIAGLSSTFNGGDASKVTGMDSAWSVALQRNG